MFLDLKLYIDATHSNSKDNKKKAVDIPTEKTKGIRKMHTKEMKV